jgi:glycosyltransferase involved in cell wall biosynthesis
VSAERLRIVHAIARLNVGGAALHVLQLAREQRSRGHDVVVAAGRLAAGEDSLEYVASELRVPVIRLDALQRELSPVQDTRAIAQIRRLLGLRRPEVLHTHTAKAGSTGRIAALIPGGTRPSALVHTFHGHVLSGYFSPRRERVFRTVERLLATRTDALVAVSDEVRDDLVALGVAPPDRVSVITYGFDLDERAAAERSAVRAQLRDELGAGDSFVVGFAGRLTAIKRPLDLVRTLHALDGRGVDATLVIAGDGEERSAAEAAAAELGVAGRCRFLGYRRDVPDLLHAFDAFLLTSANEGTPVVAIEALAAGVPVVATDAGGTPTVVEDGVSGLLAPVGDVDALAVRLGRLAVEPGLRARLGQAGAADVRRRFTTGRMADEIDDLYRRALR